MKMVKTGKGTISLLTVVAIWSLSLGVNLPGLAVSPMLDSLEKIFGHVSQMEVQLLTVLPNVLIIPFVLLSGKLSESTHKLAIVICGLAIYAGAGVLYLFSSTMAELIVISCLLGIGCGLLIPFSTGLVADVFTGDYRMRQMGIISAIGNISLVAATFVVGILATINWHLPFLVYLIPGVALLLTPWLRKIPTTDLDDNTPTADEPEAKAESATTAQAAERVVGGFYIYRILWLSVVYFLFIFVVASVAEYLPFIGMDSERVGTITAILYMAMFASGISLGKILCWLKGRTYVTSIAVMIAGVVMLVFTSSMLFYVAGAILIGCGLGVVQPVIYDKATDTVVNNSKSTLALSIILAVNYASVSLIPEITDALKSLLHISSAVFPFMLDLAILAILLVIAFVRRNKFTFAIP